MMRRGPSVYQTTHALLVEATREALVATVAAARSGGPAEPAALRAGGALYALLRSHRVDRRGRCRWCRRPWWVPRRGPTCLVYVTAHYWLHQPLDALTAHVCRELDLPAPRRTDAPRTEPIPRPSPPPGRAASDHGGAGADPDLPRSRRAPPGPGPTYWRHPGALVPGLW